MNHLFIVTTAVRFGAMGILLAGALYTRRLSQTRRRLWPIYVALALTVLIVAGEAVYVHHYREQHPRVYRPNLTP